MAEIPKRKVKCPTCGRKVSLTSAGFLRVHKREHWSGIGLYAECSASRWAPSVVIERRERLESGAPVGETGS
jgi:hypothetical protein